MLEGALMPAPDDLAPAPFQPARGLSNPHLQTVLAYLLRKSVKLPVRHELWRLPDGETLDVKTLPPQPGRPCVVVLHGLEGSSEAPYVRGLLAQVEARGWNGLALCFPSCGPTPSPSGRLYHSGRTEELALAMALVRERYPEVPLAAVGFSMGGNILFKWLGEQGTSAPLAAAVGISVPFDLALCAARLDGRGFFSFLYRQRFLISLRRKALRRLQAHGGPFTREELRRVGSFRAFDDAVTARLFGFAGADDYWQRNSSASFLRAVAIPALALAAEDDPFIPPAALPREAFLDNPRLKLEVSRHGGHVGFLGGALPRLHFWAEERALAFLAPYLTGERR